MSSYRLDGDRLKVVFTGPLKQGESCKAYVVTGQSVAAGVFWLGNVSIKRDHAAACERITTGGKVVTPEYMIRDEIYIDLEGYVTDEAIEVAAAVIDSLENDTKKERDEMAQIKRPEAGYYDVMIFDLRGQTSLAREFTGGGRIKVIPAYDVEKVKAEAWAQFKTGAPEADINNYFIKEVFVAAVPLPQATGVPLLAATNGDD